MKNTPELPNEIFSEQAKKRVSIGLLLGEFMLTELAKCIAHQA